MIAVERGDLTPELSRPVAGRCSREIVAQKRVANATIWDRIEQMIKSQGAYDGYTESRLCDSRFELAVSRLPETVTDCQ
jgi:hypothetical protein